MDGGFFGEVNVRVNTTSQELSMWQLSVVGCIVFYRSFMSINTNSRHIASNQTAVKQEGRGCST